MHQLVNIFWGADLGAFVELAERDAPAEFHRGGDLGRFCQPHALDVRQLLDAGVHHAAHAAEPLQQVLRQLQRGHLGRACAQQDCQQFVLAQAGGAPVREFLARSLFGGQLADCGVAFHHSHRLRRVCAKSSSECAAPPATSPITSARTSR
jgi:hypothetical protein